MHWIRHMKSWIGRSTVEIPMWSTALKAYEQVHAATPNNVGPTILNT